MMSSCKMAICAAAFIGALGFSSVSAQDSKIRTVEQYTCKDVMRESGADRNVAIAFLHGFLLGRSGGSTFNLDILHKQTNDFIEHCLDSPGEKSVDVMAKIKN
jgi:hypothetical protein